jgi:cyclopropane-fatty-acyl-phospholipid synthase
MTMVSPLPASLERVDPQLWPDVAAVPRSPVRAAVGHRLFRHAVRSLPLRVTEAGGRSYGGGSRTDPELRVMRPAAFFNRLGATGTIGFGEAYMAGDWTADDLVAVLAAFAAHMRELVPATLGRLRHAVLRHQPAHHDNTIEGARDNIRRHYDLSNELFTTFLDESMTYSSALFDGEPENSGEELAVAQRRKNDRLLDAAGVRSGTR